jgi:hypothetical protein
MLGVLPGFVAVGELGYVWKRTLLENRLCGCGRRFLECPFWDRVGVEAFGGWEAVDLDAVLSLGHTVGRHRFIPLLLAPRLSPEFERKMRKYGELMSTLYRAIGVVSGSRVIVDSTLDPTLAFVLRRQPDIDLRLVHLVRDSRGTAFSWTRRIERSDTAEPSGYIRTYHPASTAVRWTLDHLLVHVLSALGSEATRVRYEDLVTSPRTEIARIVEDLGEDVRGGDLAFLTAPHIVLGQDHTVAGNRMRLQHGRFTLQLDDEWKTALGERDRALTTVLSWPLLRAYGYTRRPALRRSR